MILHLLNNNIYFKLSYFVASKKIKFEENILLFRRSLLYFN